MNKRVHSSGFTIVELLIVIVVIAVLAAITVVAFNGVQQRAVVATLQSDLRNAATALRIGYEQTQSYPNDLTTLANVKKSPGTEQQYTSTGNSFCLTVSSEKTNIQPYRTSSVDGVIQEGVCDGHFTPIQIANGDRSRNVALNAAVTSNGGNSNIGRVTDGVINSPHSYFDAGHMNKYVQVDLGQNRLVGKVTVWHFYGDVRSYYDVLTQVSTDGVTWTTIFDGVTAGLYNEASTGNVITFPARQVRYIRDSMNGSTRNQANHWTEIQASYN